MKTTCYLQVEPEFFRQSWMEPRLRSVAVRRVTQRKPDSPIPGSVVVKLTLDIDDAAFLPLAPEAEVKIPVSHTEAVSVTTEPVEVPA